MKHLCTCVVLACLWSFPSIVQAYVFTVTLDKHAQVDILVYKIQPPPDPAFIGFNSNANSIARYSFYLKGLGNVKYWEQFYSRYTTHFIHPEQHFFMPSTKANPFTITLAPADIRHLAGQSDLNQVYVIIRQRTYAYNPSTRQLDFYAYLFMVQNLIGVTMNIGIVASGLIHPDKFSTMSPELQAQYPEAQNEVII